MDSLYICHFSNGHVKVGRSIDPKARIASHADRVACLGVELIEFHVAECIGRSLYQEAALIAKCAEHASRRNRSEWFEGLDYIMVCEWADSFSSSKDLAFDALVHPDAERIAALGGPARVAELVGCDKAQGGVQRVQNWITRGIPSKVKLDFPKLFLGPVRRARTEAKAV